MLARSIDDENEMETFRMTPSRIFALLLILLWLATQATAQNTTALAQVTQFDARSSAESGSESASYMAFRHEVSKREKALPLYYQLLIEGSPAARLYAAIGLYSVDVKEGKRALRVLWDDPSRVTISDGLGRQDTTVGLVAQRIFAEPEYVGLYLPREER